MQFSRCVVRKRAWALSPTVLVSSPLLPIIYARQTEIRNVFLVALCQRDAMRCDAMSLLEAQSEHKQPKRRSRCLRRCCCNRSWPSNISCCHCACSCARPRSRCCCCCCDDKCTLLAPFHLSQRSVCVASVAVVLVVLIVSLSSLCRLCRASTFCLKCDH